jgi:putative holliday junction resolvase
MNQQLLCFDFGLSSIGIATGQTDMAIATPLPEIKAKEGVPDWSVIENLIAEWQPKTLLVGLPLNMDGSESALSAKARKFGNRLSGRFGVDVEMIDERLTSRSAKEEMAEIGYNKGKKGNYKNKPVDSIAACLILEQYFNL